MFYCENANIVHIKYVAEEKLRGNLLALAFNLIAHHG